MAALRPDDGGHARRVLEHLGDEVSTIVGPCCGQPAFNSGYRSEAKSVGRVLLRAARGHETVVVPSGSCASMVRHYLPELWAGPRGASIERMSKRFVEFGAYVAAHPNLAASLLAAPRGGGCLPRFVPRPPRAGPDGGGRRSA